MNASSAVSTIQGLQNSLAVLTALQLTSYKYPQSARLDIPLNFDYVIVGAGTAGSVLAARLTEDCDVTVALIEAGGDPPYEATVPSLFAFEQKSYYDYNFLAENDNFSCQHTQQKVAQIPTGKLIGGTGSMMHMNYMRGSPEDFSHWTEIAGDDTWTYDNLLPYFIKMERLEIPEILNSGTASLHGTNGPLGLTREHSDLNTNYIKSMEELGFDYNLDVTSNPFGVTEFILLDSNGVKQSTAECYLSPAKDRKNLSIYKKTVATKILFDDNKNAFGVEAMTYDNQTVTFKANKEVIVAAGGIRSPQLLMLSGIGPRDHLAEFNIPVISDLPVGQNLRDRVSVVFGYRMQASNKTAPPPDPRKFNDPITVGLKALNDSGTVPDFQLFNIVFPPNSALGLTKIFSFCLIYENAVTDRFIEANNGHELYLGMANGKYPRSSGEVLLKSTDPLEPPKIHLGLFSTPSDVDDFGNFLKFASQIGQTSHFREVGAQIVEVDLPECQGLEYGSLDYWKCYAVAMSVPFWPATGTCSMGAVVDSNLRVKGVQNLRVVDISAHPSLTAGEPMSTVVVVAERVADLIKQSQYDSEIVDEIRMSRAEVILDPTIVFAQPYMCETTDYE